MTAVELRRIELPTSSMRTIINQVHELRKPARTPPDLLTQPSDDQP
mgnify:FL=1